MTPRYIALGIVCAPIISAVLLGLGRAGRALCNLTRKNSR